jgi:hypothetical protein
MKGKKNELHGSDMSNVYFIFFSQTNNMSIPSPINKFKIIFLENEELEHV